MQEKRVDLLVRTHTIEELKAAILYGADIIVTRLVSTDALIWSKTFKIKILLDVSTTPLYLNDKLKKISESYEIGYDGVFLSDIALGELIQKKIPNFKIILSSESGVMTPKAIEIAKIPVLLPSEIPLKEMSKLLHLGAGITVQGTVCFSYRSQCKHHLTNEHCNYACRRNGDRKRFFEIKDLCLIHHMESIISLNPSFIGIDYLQEIGETSMAAIVSLYRQALDGKKNEGTKETIAYYSPKRLTDAPFLGKKSLYPLKLTGIHLGTVKNDVLILENELKKGDIVLLGRSQQIFKLNYFRKGRRMSKQGVPGEEIRISISLFKEGSPIEKISIIKKFPKRDKIPLKFNLEFKAGKKPIVEGIALGKKVSVKGDVAVQKPKTQAIELKHIKKRLSQLTNTPFQLEEITYKDKAFIAYSNLNNLKSKLIEELTKELLPKNKTIVLENPNKKEEQTIINIKSLEDMTDTDDILSLDILSPEFSDIQNKGKKVYALLPPILADKEANQIKKLLKHYKPDGAIIFSPSFLDINIPIILGEPFKRTQALLDSKNPSEIKNYKIPEMVSGKELRMMPKSIKITINPFGFKIVGK